MPHCFERTGPSSAKTQGPEIPTWQLAKIAKNILYKHDQAGLEYLQTAWSARSVQVWNPFAEPGSPEDFIPAATSARRESPLLSFCMSVLTLELHAVPDKYYYASVEEVPDEYDTARGVGFDFKAAPSAHFKEVQTAPAAHFREAHSAPLAKAAPTVSGVSDVLSALSIAQLEFISTRIVNDEGEAFLRRRPLDRQLEI